MTGKELRRLSRQDMLQLLQAQSREIARQRSQIEGLQTCFDQERERADQLRTQLDARNETVEQLRHSLIAKDESLNKMRTDLARILDSVETLKIRLEDRGNLSGSLLDGLAEREQSVSSCAQKKPVSGNADMNETPDPRARLQRLKELLARNEAMTELLRKETK